MGLQACEKMNLIKVKSNNFEYTNLIELHDFETVFSEELGFLEGTCKFRLKEGAEPCIMPNRRVPISIRNNIKAELDRLVKLKVIQEVNEPTPWVSQAVYAKKSNGKIRICLDPRELNKCLVRERFVLPTLDETLHELSQSKYFSKFDLSQGYWHVN